MPAAVQRIKQFVMTDYGMCLCITIAWQVAFTAIGWWLMGGSPLHHTDVWDAGWYLHVTVDWYHTSAPSAAFYPLFPLLTAALHTISLGILTTISAGFIINTFALWLGLVALVKITKHILPSSHRYIPVILFLTAPAAFFMHLFYTEAIFFALSTWAYLFALRRKWWHMAILLALLSACRLPAILCVILCGLEYFRAYSWSIKKSFNTNALAFLIAPLGFILYGLYLLRVTGNFFAMFSAYHASNDWIYQVFNPNIFATIARAIYQPLRAVAGLRPFDHDLIVNNIIPLFAVTLLVVTSLYGIIRLKKQFLPLGIAGLVSVVFFSLNSNLVSVHRYTLPCLVIYLVGSYIFTNHLKLRPYITIVAALAIICQAYLYISILRGQFAG